VQILKKRKCENDPEDNKAGIGPRCSTLVKGGTDVMSPRWSKGPTKETGKRENTAQNWNRRGGGRKKSKG